MKIAKAVLLVLAAVIVGYALTLVFYKQEKQTPEYASENKYQEEAVKETIRSNANAGSKTVVVPDTDKYAVNDDVEDADEQEDGGIAEPANPEFIKAIKAGDVKAVEGFIKAGVDVNAKEYRDDEYGTKYSYTPLMSAIEANNEKIVKILLDAGADANAKGSSVGYDSEQMCDAGISLAVKSGNANIVKMLLDAGADINFQIGYYGSPVDRDPPLIEAILSGNVKILKMLLNTGADLHIKGSDFARGWEDEGGWYDDRYAIDFAVDYGNKEIIKAFIEASPDIRQKNNFISYGIYVAAAANSTEKVELLINMASGESLNKINLNSALLEAARHGNEKAVQMIIKAGADSSGKALLKAAQYDKSQNEEVIRKLLTAGAGLNETEEGFNAYIQALINGHNKTAKTLAGAGADMNINLNAMTDDRLRAGLITSVKSNSTAGAEKLLKAGASADSSDIEGGYHEGGTVLSALVLAVQNGNEKMVKILVDAGADVNAVSGGTTPLAEAVSSGNEKIFNMLVEAGADINREGHNNETLLGISARSGNKNIEKQLKENSGGWGTSLIEAVNAGDKAAVEKLIKDGADLNVADDMGFTALTRAISGSNRGSGRGELYSEIAEMLIKAGASIDPKSRDTEIAFTAAAASGNQRLLEYLLKAGVNPNLNMSNAGWTALMRAAESGNTAAVKMLIDYGADVNLKNPDKYGPVMVASSREGREKVLDLLIKAGADVNAKDKNGETALAYAANQGSAEAVDLLVKAGAAVNMRFPWTTLNGKYDNWTALFVAANRNRKEIIKILVENNADTAAKDKDGKTAYDYWLANEGKTMHKEEREKMAALLKAK